MTLPNFLGIGVQRGGTTWLHELLVTHPDVYVPTKRKEIHYFTMHNEYGHDWYESFFPIGPDANQYQAIGEVSPSYLYGSPLRIIGMPSIKKLILILRNPIDRAYSHYSLHVRDRNFAGTFEDFIDGDPYFALQDGFYCNYLKNYLDYFEREQILILIFEDAMRDIEKTKLVIADFLEIDSDRFPTNAGKQSVNSSFMPKYGGLYAFVIRIVRSLRLQNLDFLVNWAKALGLKRVFGDTGQLPPLKDETRLRLQIYFAEDVRSLESLLNIDLSHWLDGV